MASLVSPELVLVRILNSVDMSRFAASLRYRTLNQVPAMDTLNPLLTVDLFSTVAILAIYVFPVIVSCRNHAY